jgi:hypothetical protein
MTLEDLMRHFGNSYRFEVQTGMNHANYLNWLKKGYIPIVSQIRIEKITNGQLKASLSELGDK